MGTLIQPKRGPQLWLLAATLLAATFGVKPSAAQNRQPTLIPHPLLSAQVSAKAGVAKAQVIDVAAALGLDPSEVASVDFGGSDAACYDVFSSSASGFPTEGGSYLVMSSGFTSVALDANTTGSTSGDLTGSVTPGIQGGNDLCQMTLVLNVPAGATTFGFDFKFLSEEYPEFVGSTYNDGFLVEVGATTFFIQDGPDADSNPDAIAPNNVVFDSNGEQLSINTTGALGFTAGNAFGTTYDGSTQILTTNVPIAPGATTLTLVFSIFDVGDDAYDSAVFIDDAGFGGGGGGTTVADNTLPVCSGSLSGSVFSGTAEDLQSTDTLNTGIASLVVNGTNLAITSTTPPIPNTPPFPESVAFEVEQVDPTQDGTGVLIAEDGNRNQCQLNIFIPGDPNGGGICSQPSSAPSYAGGYVLNSAGTRAFIKVMAPTGGTSFEFYNTSNLVIGLAEADAESGNVLPGQSRAGNTFSFGAGDEPMEAFFPITTAGSGTGVSFFLRITDTCPRTVDVDPSFTLTGVEEENGGQFALRSAQPSPTAGQATLSFSLGTAAPAQLAVYDVLGREVARLVDGMLSEGTHTVGFDGSNLPAGVYVYRLTAGGQTLTRTLTIAR